MATEQELADALRKADAAGNSEDAKRFADAIRAMRADAQRRQPATEQELADALRKADAAGNNEDAKRLADAIRAMRANAAQQSQSATSLPLSVPAQLGKAAIDRIVPAARGLASTLGLAVPADVAGQAIGAAARGQPIDDIDTLLDRARERGRGLRERFPATTFAGSLAAGGPVVGAVKGIGRRALAGAATGATGAALFNVSEEGGDGLVSDVATGAGFGGAIGAAGPKIVEAGRAVIGGALRKLNPEKAAARIALNRSALSPDELKTAAQSFADQTTRAPTLVEVGGPQTAAELQRIAVRSPKAKDFAESAEEASDIARQTSLPRAILKNARGERLTPGRLEKRTSDKFEREFNPIRRNAVPFDELDEVEISRLQSAASVISDPVPGFTNLRTTLSAQLLARKAEADLLNAQSAAQKAAQSGDPQLVDRAQRNLLAATRADAQANAIAKENPITLDDLDKARRVLGTKAKGPQAAPGQNVNTPDLSELRDSITEIGARVSPKFSAALGRFGQRSKFTEEAFGQRAATRKGKIGNTGLAARSVSATENPEAFADAIRRASAAQKKGAAAGAFERLAGQAESGPQGAATVSASIATNAGLQRRLRDSIGKAEADRIIDIAKLENAARQNFKLAARGQRLTKTEIAAEEISTIAKTGFITKTGGASLASFAADIAENLLVPKNVAERLTENFFDPDKSAQAIAQMRKIAENDEAFFSAVRSAALRAGIATSVTGASSTEPESNAALRE